MQMTNLPTTETIGEIAENFLIEGDYSKLTPEERVTAILKTCKSLGLNPLTRPLQFIKMPNGRTVLYATRDCADQLRKIHGISIEITKESYADGLYRVGARATTPEGRKDEDRGVVAIGEKAAGEFRANLELKAVTKAKRRVTLSICGLGFLDETEIEDIVLAQDSEQLIADTDAPEQIEGEVEHRYPPGDVSVEEAALRMIETMGREAAIRGRDVFDKFYKVQTKDGQARLRQIKPELEKLFPK